MKEQTEVRSAVSSKGEVENKSTSPRESRSNVNTATMCDIHSAVLLYCPECEYVVCGQCEKRQHVSHKLIKMQEASRLNKVLLSNAIEPVKNLIRYANIVIKDLNSYISKMDKNISEIASQVLQRSTHLPEGTEDVAHNMLAKIETEHDLETNRIRNKITEFDEYISLAKNIAVNLENLVNAVDDQHVLMKGNVVLKQVESLEGSLPVCLRERRMYVLSPLQPPSDDQPHPPEEWLESFTKVEVPWRIEVCRTGSYKPDTVSSRFVTTMCPAEDEHIWVVWQWGPHVHLVNKEGVVVKSVDVGCKIDDICSNNGNLIISCHEGKCIKILDKSQNLETVRTLKTEKVPRGIYPISSKEIVSCGVTNLHHRNGDTSTIMRLDAESGEVKEMPVSEHLIQPWRIAVNVNGDICVSDRNKGCVMIFDIKGNLKNTYSGPELSTRHPFAPHAICCDKHGQIFIVDYTNHTVHVLDPLGRFRGFLIMDTELENRAIFMGTSSPFAITMDSVGDIWVGNKFGYLTVLKI